MTPEEKFKLAQSLTNDIATLEKHERDVRMVFEDQHTIPRFIIKGRGRFETFLSDAFMPIDTKYILKMYLMGVEKEIESMKAKFNNLLS